MDYQERKEERRKQHAREHGKKLVTCSACSGSGYYDHNGSPPCGGCGGTGKVRETTYAAPIERKVVRHPRKGEPWASLRSTPTSGRPAAARAASMVRTGDPADCALSSRGTLWMNCFLPKRR